MDFATLTSAALTNAAVLAALFAGMFAVLAALAAGVFGLVAAWINRGTGRSVAVIQVAAQREIEQLKLDGQRRLERDKAIRDDRQKEVKPLLTFADRRFVQLVNDETWWLGVGQEDEERRADLLPVPEEDKRWLLMSHVVADEGVRTAFRRVRDTYRVIETRTASQPVPASEEWDAFNMAVRELHDAARAYVYGP